MIILDVQKYCGNCPNLEPYVHVEKVEMDDKLVCNTYIRCVREDKCKNMYRYLKNGGKEK